VWLATDLSDSLLAGDDDENITLERMPLAEAIALIEHGEIKDGKSIAGLLLAAEHERAGRST
jgi:hypothetical protein